MEQAPGMSATFVFTDIEGSTQLLDNLHTSYGLALRLQRQIIKGRFEEHRGDQIGTEGDGLFWHFPTPGDAVVATLSAQARFKQLEVASGTGLRVRMGVHCGPVRLSGGEYIGMTIHEAARVCAAAHGDQVLCSAPVREATGHLTDVSFLELGSFVLRGIPAEHTLYQVSGTGDIRTFPPPRDAVRAGGTRLTIWRRQPSKSPSAVIMPDRLTFTAPDGTALAGDVTVEVLPASSSRAGAFRIVVCSEGSVVEEYDGLTIGGQADVAAILAANSRLIRVDRSPRI